MAISPVTVWPPNHTIQERFSKKQGGTRRDSRMQIGGGNAEPQAGSSGCKFTTSHLFVNRCAFKTPSHCHKPLQSRTPERPDPATKALFPASESLRRGLRSRAPALPAQGRSTPPPAALHGPFPGRELGGRERRGATPHGQGRGRANKLDTNKLQALL